MRTRLLSKNPQDVVWLGWAKGQAQVHFGQNNQLGSRTVFPDPAVRVKYGRDGAGLFAEVWRTEVYGYVFESLPNPEGYKPVATPYLRTAATEAQGKNDPWGFITTQVYAGNIVPHPIFRGLQLSFDFLYHNSLGVDSFIQHFDSGSGFTDIWAIHYHNVNGADIQDGASFYPDVYRPYTQYVPFPDVTAQNDAAIAAAQAAATSENTTNNRVDPQDPVSMAAWHKRASDAVLAALKAGTLPRGWDYVLKRNAPRSTKTVRLPRMVESFSDVINGDLTTRTVTLSYTTTVTQADGTVVSTPHVWSIEGSREYTHGNPDGDRALYSNWYIQQYESVPNPDSVQFVADGWYGMGLLWNGASTKDTSLTYENPPFVNLVGSAPQFVIDYRKAVHPKSASEGNPLWNDSALTNGELVNLILFGPHGKGIFGTWADDTKLDVYGVATFQYSYDDGSFSFVKWSKPLDADGNATDVLVIDTHDNAHTAFNALVCYGPLVWSDAVAQATQANSDIKPPTPPDPDNRSFIGMLKYSLTKTMR